MNRIEVVCGVLQDEAGRLLIAQRRSAIADGIWEFPGGKVEADETREAACIRELQEELGVIAMIDEFLCEFDDPAFEPLVHVSAYRAHIVSGSICFHDHHQGRWVMADELTDYCFQAADEPLLTLLKARDKEKTFPGQ